MKIGVILNYERDWPPGIRAEKQTVALANAGHEVFVFSPKFKENAQSPEYLAAVKATVVRVPLPTTAKRYIKNVITAVTLYDNRFYHPIINFIKDYNLDVLHVHDIWLIPVSLKAAKIYNIPVVADLHENMPAAKRAARSEQGFLRHLIEGVIWNYHLMRWHEARMLRRCAHTFIVAPEAGERLLEYGINEDKISVVSNTEDETTFNDDEKAADPIIVKKYVNTFMCSYIGTTGAHRGLDTVLKAIPIAAKVVHNLKLVVVGADPSNISRIAAEVKRLDIANYVEVIGWQPFDKVHSYIMASDICLVPHNDFEHTQTTIPHKLFQYMICRKPVLVSDCRPLKRIVEDSNCGGIFKASDAENCAEVLLEMYNNKDGLAQLGENGRSAALGKFAWKNDAKVMIEAFYRIEKDYYNPKDFKG
jgi:glycosyltransferase involved in cell wall biosynthesis